MGMREVESVSEGELGGGGCLDGGIPYLLRRGCCSVVQDCLELPPVPGIFEGKTKACDGPDLLELPFFYVSLHFLLCYTPPSSIFSTLSGSLLFFLPLCFAYTLRLSTDIPPVPLFPGDILHFTINILIILCSSASSLCRTTCECPETRARYVVVWRDQGAYLCDYVRGMEIQKGAMRFGYTGHKHVERHEIMILPQHTEVIILLESTG